MGAIKAARVLAVCLLVVFVAVWLADWRARQACYSARLHPSFDVPLPVASPWVPLAYLAAGSGVGVMLGVVIRSRVQNTKEKIKHTSEAFQSSRGSLP